MPDLPVSKQQALWERFLIERNYCRPARYGRLMLKDMLGSRYRKLFKRTEPFLSEDFRASPNASYPYPAKMPSFLAALGIYEIERWPGVAAVRKEILSALLKSAGNNRTCSHIPRAYLDPHLEIIPLRFVWTQPDGALIRDKLSRFLNVSQTWFLQPIIATSAPLEHFGFARGTCPISEQVGPGMINIPCNLSRDDSKMLIELFQSVMSFYESNVSLSETKSMKSECVL
jgi:hypothetical protein